jgi:short-subunit dehydrogenase
MELSGKLAIVTGASRGIGRALAIELAKSNCSLLLTALEGDELLALSNELRSKSSVPVEAMACDLSDLESRKNLINWILNWKEPPDILINNAGLGYFGRFEDSDWSRIEKTIALNISSLIHLTYELIPILRQRPSAKIVNISSGMARLPYPGLAVYGATKGFASSFSESLASELSGTSIRILCFHPGFAMTSFISSAGMNMQKVPRILIHSPEEIAMQIVRAIRKDKQWAYSDFLTRFSAWLGALLPSSLKTSILKDLFWRLPDAK